MSLTPSSGITPNGTINQLLANDGADGLSNVNISTGLSYDTVTKNLTASSIGTTLTDGHILVGDASNQAADVAMSGDVTISNTGVTAIKSSVALAGDPTTTTQSASDSSTKIATTAMVQAAIAAAVASGASFRGGYDASSNVFPSTGGSGTAGAIQSGDFWVITVAGTLGGEAVAVGSLIFAIVDNPGQTASNWVTVNANFVVGPASATDGALCIYDGTTGKLIKNTGITVTGGSLDAINAASLNLSGLTASYAVVTDGSKNLTSLQYTNANTASTLVQRDGSGNFSAGTITAALSGNASTATALQTARTIGGVSFDGTANITVASATGGFSISGGDLTLANGLSLKTNTTTGNTALFQAYDVDNTTYRTFATLTNGNTPSFNITAPSGGTVAIDGATIGANTAAAGTFTTLIGNTISASDATTPTITTASGKTNTGYVQVNGKTSGALRITAADATAQTVTLTTAAQTTGAGTLTIPDMAGTSKTLAWLESPSFTTPALGTPSSGNLANCTGYPAPSGSVVQTVIASTSAVATGTTVMPSDDTIPQNTEGDEYITASITPTNTNNKLLINFNGWPSASILVTMCGALFQDSTANALAAVASTCAGVQFLNPMVLTYSMTAGTTSSTTFKVRIGPASAATITLNGQNGGRWFGGRASTTLIITEIKV